LAVVIPAGHPVGERIGTAKEPRMYSTGKPYMAKVPVWSDPPPQLRPDIAFEMLEPLFFSETMTKVAHGITYDIPAITKYYPEMPLPPFDDTMVLPWLLDENRRNYALKPLTKSVYGVEYDFENVGKCVENFGFNKVAHYNYMDVLYTWLHYTRCRPLITADDLEAIHQIEQDLMPTFCAMRLAGQPVDVPRLEELRDVLNARLVDQEGSVYSAAGKRFNINSAPQKQELLFLPKAEGGQGLRPWKLTDGGQKKKDAGEEESHQWYSTDDEVLEGFPRNPLASALRDYGDTHKLLNTYVVSWLGDGEEKEPQVFDGRIHAGFKQGSTVTGRTSCLSADSLIEMPRDLLKDPGGIRITDVQPGDWVYAFDWQRELVLRQVKWVGQTGMKQTVVVTAENSEGHRLVLRATPEHLVRLRNGDWRPAGSLMHRAGAPHRDDGPRVMTMVKRGVDDGYVKFFPHSVAQSHGTKGGGKNREHRWVYEQVTGKKISTKTDVHHHDCNRANNSISNLEALTIAEHRGRRHLHPHWGAGNPFQAPDLYAGPTDYHVVSVSPGPVEPVWDMEVDGVHNFIANGICVHNCAAPNLQNIPRPDTEDGKLLRSTFIASLLDGLPDPDGDEVLVVGDLGQIELVILAHLIGYGALFEGFHNGIDPHLVTAAGVTGKTPDQVTKGERQTLGKTLNFTVVNGAGPHLIGTMIGGGYKDGLALMKKYDRDFPEVPAFKRQVFGECRSRRPPHVVTLLGRKRRVLAMLSGDKKKRAAAERQVFNSLIQGGAADLIKLAMIRFDDRLQQHVPEAYLTMTVHDELVAVSPRGKAEYVRELMVDAMTGPGIQKYVKVPLTVDAQIVDRWSEAKA